VALDDENIQTISQSSSSEQQNCEAVIYDVWRHENDPYLAAGYARTERVVADADFFIDDMVRKVVLSPSHRTDEHNDMVCFG